MRLWYQPKSELRRMVPNLLLYAWRVRCSSKPWVSLDLPLKEVPPLKLELCHFEGIIEALLKSARLFSNAELENLSFTTARK